MVLRHKLRDHSQHDLLTWMLSSGGIAEYGGGKLFVSS